MAQFLTLVGTVIALSLIFLMFERVRPAQENQDLGRWLFNLAYAPFIIAFIYLLAPLLTASSAFVARLASGGLLPAVNGGLTATILFALAYALVFDLSQYAMHRLQHWSPFLWETHRFHHDETAVNAATQARHHPTSHVLAAVFHLPIAALFGLQAPHAVAIFLMFTLWGFVNHANVRISFGPLTSVIAGPQWHRIHHSILEEHRDRNFATFFPFIDMMFGTYYRPKSGEFPPTGLEGCRAPSLAAGTYEPLLAWRRMAMGRIGRRFARAPNRQAAR